MKRFIPHTRTLILLVVLLLLANLFLVAYMVMEKKSASSRTGRDRSAIESRIQRELGLSREQSAAFHTLFQQHMDSVKLLGDELLRAKQAFYQLMRAPAVNDSGVQAASRELSLRQQQMELHWFRHFSRVRALCNEPQRVKYDSMVTRMVNRRSWGR